jgi:multiple sugar transport system permease protein
MKPRLFDTAGTDKYPPRTGLKKTDNLNALLSVAPMLVLILAFTVYPVFSALMYSFTKWNGVEATLIWLRNYRQIITDIQFWRLLLNNLIFILSVPLQIVIALVITVLLYEKIAGWKFFRALFFLPNVLSSVVIGWIFRQAFMYEGPVNEVLRRLHLDFLALDWLSNGPSAMFVIISSVVWTNFGYGVLIFLAGMSTITPSILEAALIDGANWVQKVVHIVLPMLARVIEFFSITTIIWIFTGLFGYIFAITNGGPGYATTPLEYMIYLKAFKAGSQMGYACALAVILLLITFAISRLQMFVTERIDTGEG